MLDLEAARQLVLRYINGNNYFDNEERILVDEETITKPYGWIFFYNTRRYLETGDFSFALAGNGPIIVNSASGDITVISTASLSDDYTKKYEEQLHMGELRPQNDA